MNNERKNGFISRMKLTLSESVGFVAYGVLSCFKSHYDVKSPRKGSLADHYHRAYTLASDTSAELDLDALVDVPHLQQDVDAVRRLYDDTFASENELMMARKAYTRMRSYEFSKVFKAYMAEHATGRFQRSALQGLHTLTTALASRAFPTEDLFWMPESFSNVADFLPTDS